MAESRGGEEEVADRREAEASAADIADEGIDANVPDPQGRSAAEHAGGETTTTTTSDAPTSSAALDDDAASLLTEKSFSSGASFSGAAGALLKRASSLLPARSTAEETNSTGSASSGIFSSRTGSDGSSSSPSDHDRTNKVILFGGGERGDQDDASLCTDPEDPQYKRDEEGRVPPGFCCFGRCLRTRRSKLLAAAGLLLLLLLAAIAAFVALGLTGNEAVTSTFSAFSAHAPTDEPTPSPTPLPTAEPTPLPTPLPTAEPTDAPTDPPTDEPTAKPTAAPTYPPTNMPTDEPTMSPTDEPTYEPTLSPTDEPTLSPTDEPTTARPTVAPSHFTPTRSPTVATPYGRSQLTGREYVFAQGVVDRIDSSSSCIPDKDYDEDTATVLAVTNRENYIGCHSWDEYFSPHFRTIIVVNERVADEWRLDDLVRNVPCSRSLGATLLKLERFGGELYGRQKALDWIEAEHPNTQFLMQMNCDVHAPPRWHNQYRSVRNSVLKSARDFHLVRTQREPNKYGSSEVKRRLPDFNLVDDVKDRAESHCDENPVLGMSFILLEDFADEDDLVLHFHGVDGCAWQRKGGRAARPDKFGSHPWMCAGDRWENHALFFDVTKLRQVRSVYLDGPVAAGTVTYPSDTRFGPKFSRHFGMCMITHRDVYFHQDFAQEDSNAGDALEKYDPHVDKDTVRVLNLASLCSLRNPANPYYLFKGYDDAGITPFIGGTGMDFYGRHVTSRNSPWMPHDVVGKSLQGDEGAFDPGAGITSADDNNLAVTLLTAKMELFGYERYYRDDDCPLNSICYRMAGVYPGNNYVFATEERLGCTDCWEFMRIGIKDGDGNEEVDDDDTMYHLTAVAGVTNDEIRSMEPVDRIVVLPAEGAYVARFTGPYDIRGKENISHKGWHRLGSSTWPCGAPDQNPDRACGYLDTPEFDIPY